MDHPFIQWLKRQRAALNLTQAALALRIGCSVETVRAIENARRRPSAGLAERLAAALELPPDQRAAFVRLARTLGTDTADPSCMAPPTQAPDRAPDLAGVGTLPIARTKLQPPRTHADVLLRPRLVERVAGAIGSARLVLISAPAGSGKTTLLTSALAVAGHPAIWIAVDEDDDDLVRFLMLLISAIERRMPSVGSSARRTLLAQASLDTMSPAQLGDLVITALINDLPENDLTPYLVVLDDLHLVADPAIFAAIALLIERLPVPLTVAIATRHDPPIALARWRARRELVELRLPDLRFTVGEAAALLNAQLGLALSRSEVQTLVERTEGWASGLSLLAASLERTSGPEDRARLLSRLAQIDQHIFAYLAEEVLERQDPFVRMFLLETSVLPELIPEVCQALTGRDDAAAILDELYRRNLFLVVREGAAAADAELAYQAAPPERAPAVYRYHDLFREFLLARLRREAPGWLADLHRRAAAVEPVPLQRLFHQCAAEDWDGAATTLLSIGPELLARGAYESLRSWVERLPGPVQDAHPQLLIWLGFCRWQRFAADAARACFTRALQQFEAMGDPLGQGEALAWLALDQSLYGDSATAHAIAERALTFPLPPHLRVRLLAARALGLVLNGHTVPANATLEQALDLAEAAADPRVSDALVQQLHAPLAVVSGGVARFERALRLANSAMPELLAPSLSRRSLQISIGLWRGSWEEVLRSSREVARLLSKLGAMRWEAISGSATIAITTAIRGAPEEDPMLALVLGMNDHTASAFARSVALTFQFHAGRAAWLRGDLDELRRIRRHVAEVAREAQIGYVASTPLLLEGLVALAEQRYDVAEPALRQAAAIQDRLPFTVLLADAYVLLASLKLALGQAEAALALFAPRLAEYARDDVPGLLMWQGRLVIPLLQLASTRGIETAFAARTLGLLRAWAPDAVLSEAADSAAPPAVGEALSAREREVLRLLARGASNAEIATRLVISPHTAKHHVSRVLAKLGAASRAEAIHRAHALGLV